MANWEKILENSEMRREEIIRIIEHSIEKLSLEELESLYYDMVTKNYIKAGSNNYL